MSHFMEKRGPYLAVIVCMSFYIDSDLLLLDIPFAVAVCQIGDTNAHSP